jgi:hypothetical protein
MREEKLQALFNDEEIPIYEKSTPPFLLTLFKKSSITDKEQYNDPDLINLKLKCESLFKQKATLLQSMEQQKAEKPHNKLDEALSYQFDLDKINTEIQFCFDKINIIQKEIANKIKLFLKQKTVFLSLLDKVSLKSMSTDFDFRFEQDETTAPFMQKLDEYAKKITQIQKELNFTLEALISSHGRKKFPNAKKRYQAALSVYQSSTRDLLQLQQKIVRARKPLMHSAKQLADNNALYEKNLTDLSNQINLSSLGLSIDAIQKPPYDAFDVIKENTEYLRLFLTTIQDYAETRKATIDSLKKQPGWIKKTADIEAINLDILQSIKSKIEIHYHPLSEKIIELQTYIQETKDLIHNTHEQALAEFNTLATQFLEKNKSVQGIGLNPTAKKDAQAVVDTIDIVREALLNTETEMLQLNDNMLFNKRQDLTHHYLCVATKEKNKISKALEQLQKAIIQQKNQFNTKIKKSLTFIQVLRDKTDNSHFNYNYYYLDPGEYHASISGKTLSFKLTPYFSKQTFFIQPSIENELQDLLFAPPLTDETEEALFTNRTKTLNKVRAHLNNLEERRQAFITCRKKRLKSDLIIVTQKIRSEIKEQLNAFFELTSDPRVALLKEIDRNIHTLEKRYCDLQIKDKPSFIKEAIKTVKYSIIHNDLERLSDRQQNVLLQFIRLRVLRPLRHLLELTLIDKGKLSWFAAPNEIAMMKTGKTAISHLEELNKSEEHSAASSEGTESDSPLNPSQYAYY